MKVASAFEWTTKHEMELISRYLENVESQYSQEVARLDTESDSVSKRSFDDPDDYDWYEENIADEFSVLEDIRNLGEQLGIVAAYRVVETKMKQILKWRYRTENLDGLNIQGVKERLSRLGINLEGTPHYRAADELRLLNNSIKHNDGQVSPPLAGAFPVWHEGEKLRDLEDTFNRLTPEIPKFIQALAEQVIV